MESRSPACFACHVVEEEAAYQAADFAILGCCSGMHLFGDQHTNDSNLFGIAQSFTALRIGFLPFWLLTAQLQDAGVQFGMSASGVDSGAPSISSVRIFGKELACPLPAEVFYELFFLRKQLSSFGRGHEHCFEEDGEELKTGSFFALNDCREVSDAVDRLLELTQDVVGSPGFWCAAAPGKLAWCRAAEATAETAGEEFVARLRDLGDLQQEAAVKLGTTSSQLVALRSAVVRRVLQTSNCTLLGEMLRNLESSAAEEIAESQRVPLLLEDHVVAPAWAAAPTEKAQAEWNVLQKMKEMLRGEPRSLNELNQRICKKKPLKDLIKQAGGKGVKGCTKEGPLRISFFAKHPAVFSVS